MLPSPSVMLANASTNYLLPAPGSPLLCLCHQIWLAVVSYDKIRPKNAKAVREHVAKFNLAQQAAEKTLDM